MSDNPAVSLLLKPLRRMVQAGHKADEWYDRHRDKIDSEKAANGLSDSQAMEQHESAVADDQMVERTLNLYDPFRLTREIEGAITALRDAGASTVANQFDAIVLGVDETGGDEKVPMQELSQLLQTHCPIETESQPEDYPDPENYERDLWVYKQREAGRTWPKIIDEMERDHGQDWTFLESDDQCRRVVKRITHHHGWPAPKVKPGRPSVKR